MSPTLYAGLLSLGLFSGMLLLLDVGRRIGVRRLARDPNDARAGLATIDAAVLALLGLLLAFTVAGAGERFDVRRTLIVEEANAIGTAYLRLDMLPDAAQPALREKFRRYVDARLDVYRKLPDVAAARDALVGVSRLQGEIWRSAVAAARSEGAHPQVAVLVLPPLNQMIDITTTRTMATLMHPPQVIFIMLFALALLTALLSGHAMAGGRSRNWLHMLCFAAIIATTVYIILDMEYPRAGLLRVDAFDQALTDVRRSMD